MSNVLTVPFRDAPDLHKYFKLLAAYLNLLWKSPTGESFFAVYFLMIFCQYKVLIFCTGKNVFGNFECSDIALACVCWFNFVGTMPTAYRNSKKSPT